MSFVAALDSLPLKALVDHSVNATLAEAQASMARQKLSLADFAALIGPNAAGLLEPLCQKSRALTLRRFGKVIRFFAPIYVSNECVNNCKYCGFSRDNPILRVTLSIPELSREVEALKNLGFRDMLLVAGEHPKFVSNGYLRDCIRVTKASSPSVSLEVAPLSLEEYKPLVEEGADGLTVFQETYDRSIYTEMHTSGPKRDFVWRLETPERGYEAGMRRLGISALYGLGDWRYEAICVAAHAEYLLRNCWKAQITISMPRLRPCAGTFQPRSVMTDRDLVRLVCAFRLFMPDVGLVLSTRESAKLRDGLMQIGITTISAGSHTEPGGYTGVGQERLHHTVRGRVMSHTPTAEEKATGQFDIADERSAAEVANLLRTMGYEPVWKDWDAALTK